MLAGFIVMVTALWSMDNKEYLDTMNEQLAKGYSWEQIECRAPTTRVQHITIETPLGNKYVCNKLIK